MATVGKATQHLQPTWATATLTGNYTSQFVQNSLPSREYETLPIGKGHMPGYTGHMPGSRDAYAQRKPQASLHTVSLGQFAHSWHWAHCEVSGGLTQEEGAMGPHGCGLLFYSSRMYTCCMLMARSPLRLLYTSQRRAAGVDATASVRFCETIVWGVGRAIYERRRICRPTTASCQQYNTQQGWSHNTQHPVSCALGLRVGETHAY